MEKMGQPEPIRKPYLKEKCVNPAQRWNKKQHLKQDHTAKCDVQENVDTMQENVYVCMCISDISDNAKHSKI